MKEAISKYRIISIDGAKLYKYAKFKKNLVVTYENKNIDKSFFSGYLDNNLEIEPLRKSYKRHIAEFGGKPFCVNTDDSKYPATLALVSVSFSNTVKDYNRVNGYTYVKLEYEDIFEEEKLEDHVLIVNGTLVAVEALDTNLKKDVLYKKVVNPIDFSKYGLEKFFKYDPDKKLYYRTEADLNKINESSNANKEEIRKEIYINGFNINSVHYVRYKRSAGSGREGQCLFIAEPLYDDMMNWTNEGLNLDRNSIKDLTSYEAYCALTLSNIIGTINIKKNEILIMRDINSVFNKKVAAVFPSKIDPKNLDAEVREFEVENKIWDGESLLDESVFIESQNNSKAFKEIELSKKGMMLLRNKYFKSCAFNTKLQTYFKENEVTLKDLNGFTLAKDISQIKLIVTDSSVKYLKLCGINGKSSKKDFDACCKIWLNAVPDIYGVVKTDKKTHYLGGKLVRTNYQLINTLGFSELQMKELLKDSLFYLGAVKDDISYMRHYLNTLNSKKENDISNFNDDYNAQLEKDDSYDLSYESKVVKKMINITDKFAGTGFYEMYKENFRNSFCKILRNGHIFVKGTYATLFGNGAELLYASHHKDYNGEIIALELNQVYNTTFPFDTDFLCARSPHITMGNLLGVTNVNNEYYSKYFNLTDEIICVNAINHNIQNRLNGCDYDSDTVLITDNRLMVGAAKINRKLFPIPAYDQGDGKGEKVKYSASLEDLAEMDIAISNNRIGNIVNLSQFLNSLYWDDFNRKTVPAEKNDKELYLDICKLAVLSGIEIDKAKRSFPIESQDVLKQLDKRRKDYSEKYKLPGFYNFIRSSKPNEDGKAKYDMQTSMEFLNNIVLDKKLVHEVYSKKAIRKNIVIHTNIKDLLGNFEIEKGSNDSRTKLEIVKLAKDTNKVIRKNNAMMGSKLCNNKEMLVDQINTNINEFFEYVDKHVTNTKILQLLVDEIDKDQKDPVNKLITGALCLKCKLFNDILINNCENEVRYEYILDELGNTQIFGYNHKKVLIKKP